ncbi:MAG TPA: NrfD/PsrC family molybdoenzyme membrane anchor subunit [Ktedonobacteraceae bacterium]|nr:NrfD/PsrC family molybdoenzyme membrane anchor subunit [Ktedonobacteraceae bacterium]
MDESRLLMPEVEERALAAKLLENFMPTQLAERLAVLTTGYTPNPGQEQKEPSYYDYPVLKAPVWKWEIIWYFFFGGLAAGCYVIASIASLFGSAEDRAVVRAGYYASLLALLPCPPLLIKDLGRPERFLHMLRIFRVKSPMSMGVYGLVSLSAFSGLAAVIQGARDGLLGVWWGARWLAKLPQKLLAVPGTFCALFLGGYTGVLLAATSVPLWSRSKLLGSVFISSAISTSSALMSLILHLVGAPGRTLRKLGRLEWTALLVEMTGLLAFLRGSGRAARPLVGTGPGEKGRTFWGLVFGSGLLLPWLLQSVGLFGKHTEKRKRGRGILISLLVLIGGYFLRKTIVEAGHTSSKDARTTLWHARSKGEWR